jgi:hypothetical protein
MRTDLFEATVQGWARLNASRQRLVRNGIEAKIHIAVITSVC